MPQWELSHGPPFDRWNEVWHLFGSANLIQWTAPGVNSADVWSFKLINWLKRICWPLTGEVWEVSVLSQCMLATELKHKFRPIWRNVQLQHLQAFQQGQLQNFLRSEFTRCRVGWDLPSPGFDQFREGALVVVRCSWWQLEAWQISILKQLTCISLESFHQETDTENRHCIS